MNGLSLDRARAELAPSGTLRAALNMANFLLVKGRDAADQPDGVAPDLARAIAARLGVQVRFIEYPRPTVLGDAAGTDAWDIGMIGADPQRAEKIAFTAPYVEIEATYLVPEGSAIAGLADVDRPGVRIVTAKGSAYGLWLDRHVVAATLVEAASLDEAFRRFDDDRLEALSGLRPRLILDQAALPGSRVLDGRFMTVQQAIGVDIGKTAGRDFLDGFLAEVKSTGLLAEAIERHHVQGLTIAR